MRTAALRTTFVLLLATATLSIGSTAWAAGKTSTPPQTVVAVDGGGTITIYSPTADDKATWEKKYSPTATYSGPSSVATPQYTVWEGNLSSSGSVPVLGSTIKSSGSTHLKETVGWWVYADYTSSSGYFAWYGSSPINAQQIKGALKWWLSGVDVSVTIPGGVGFSKSGSGLLWQPGPVYNLWHHSMSYAQNVHLQAAAVSSCYYRTMADFLINNNWYHVQGA